MIMKVDILIDLFLVLLDTGWYHVVTAFDTTQSTSSNRIKFYINGEQITDFSTETYPSQNYDNSINESGVAHRIAFQTTIMLLN